MPDARIAGLEPYGLDVVPGHDDGDPQWRERWRDWRDNVTILRDKIHALCSENPLAREDEMALCAEDPAYFVAMWLWIEEPRVRDGEDVVKPYVPFAFQVDMVQWMAETMADSRPMDGYVSKARGLGASWTAAAVAYWVWLFKPWRIKMVSRKEDLVDKPLDIDSLFGKLDFFMLWTPRWMMPIGFKKDEHRLRLMLRNPASTAQITGESTSSKTARGARATAIIYDECAFMQGFKDIWGTGSGTTEHRFGISSESFEESMEWYSAWNQAKKSSPESVKELNWFENAYFDDDWYAEERQRWVKANDIEGFEREVNRNPYAGSGQWVYPLARELPVLDIPYDYNKILVFGIDPGHSDETAIVWGHPRFDDGQRGIDWLDSYERNLVPVEWYAHLLTGVPPEQGDECWGIHVNERERDLMAFFSQLPWTGDRIKMYMDPAGSQKHSGISFFDIFVKKTLELRMRHVTEQSGKAQPLVPLYQALMGVRNFHDERRNATRQGLQKSRFNNNEGGLRIQEALSNYQFARLGERATNEPKPVHNSHSHVATACEFVYSYLSIGMADPPKRKSKELLLQDTLSGRRIA